MVQQVPEGSNNVDATIGLILCHTMPLQHSVLEATRGGDVQWERAMSPSQESKPIYLHGFEVKSENIKQRMQESPGDDKHIFDQGYKSHYLADYPTPMLHGVPDKCLKQI